MTASIQQENSKLEKAGKVNALPSPSVPWKPNCAWSGSWSVSAPFPSRAESFSPCTVSCLELGDRIWGSAQPQGVGKVRPLRREGARGGEPPLNEEVADLLWTIPQTPNPEPFCVSDRSQGNLAQITPKTKTRQDKWLRGSKGHSVGERSKPTPKTLSSLYLVSNPFSKQNKTKPKTKTIIFIWDSRVCLITLRD